MRAMSCNSPSYSLSVCSSTVSTCFSRQISLLGLEFKDEKLYGRKFLLHQTLRFRGNSSSNGEVRAVNGRKGDDLSPWNEKPYELLPSGKIAYLDEQDILTSLQAHKLGKVSIQESPRLSIYNRTEITQLYEILEHRGSGAYPDVYRGRRLSDDLIVALKEIHDYQSSFREIEALQILQNSPNIIVLHEYFWREDEDGVLVLEFLSLPSLPVLLT